jgi:hypothetical protein
LIAVMTRRAHASGARRAERSAGNSELLLWGDIVHNAALRFAEPERAITFDTDRAIAIATRKRVFDMTAGARLPFPGLGHVARTASGYAYVPVEWGADL